MKIGIELNHIVRDINYQLIKYYIKDIDSNFDKGSINLNDLDLVNKLPFKTKKERQNFLYIDYPYEIYGCANQIERNLVNSINEWEINMNDLDDGNEYEIVFFSCNEHDLTIQSSYYFLSKIGIRAREVHFPKYECEIWDYCDVVITTNRKIINSKPSNKIGIYIHFDKRQPKPSNADYVFDKMIDVIKNQHILTGTTHINMYTFLKNKIKNFFKKLLW